MSSLAFGLDEGIAHDDQARRSRWFVIGLLSLLLGLGGWAWVAPIDKVVRAEGRIIPSAKSQMIQHLEGGIIAELQVREGQTVRQGQLLVSIDPTRADATLSERKAKRQGLAARAARLQAEAEGQPSVRLPADLSPAASVVRAEIDAFNSRRERVGQEVRVLQEQIAQKRAELAEQENRQKSLGAEMEVARKQLAVVTGMMSRQSASQMELLDAQAKVKRYETQIQDSQSAVPKLRAAIAEIDERIRDASARFRAEARTELAQSRAELDRVDQEIRGESDRVARTEVRAPVAGVINRVYVNTVGGVIKPGDAIFELTPSDEKIVIEGRVRPADRADLHEGVRANVRLSAFESSRYGTLAGEVTEVSADTLPDERGERFYRVKVAVDAATSRIPLAQLSPGMTATADLVTGRRTVMDYLLSPLTKFASRALSEPR